MDFQIKDTFFDSLKNLKRNDSWWYKSFSFFRYDLKRFIKNLWFFRKELWDFRPYDYNYNMKLFGKSLDRTSDYVEEHGYEIDETRLKKVAAMRRASIIIDNIIDHKYTDLAEAELGREYILRGFEFEELDHLSQDGQKLFQMKDNLSDEEKALNKELRDLSQEIEESEWNELFRILKGQPHGAYNPDIDGDWNKYFDGTGLRCWWD